MQDAFVFQCLLRELLLLLVHDDVWAHLHYLAVGAEADVLKLVLVESLLGRLLCLAWLQFIIAFFYIVLLSVVVMVQRLVAHGLPHLLVGAGNGASLRALLREEISLASKLLLLISCLQKLEAAYPMIGLKLTLSLKVKHPSYVFEFKHLVLDLDVLDESYFKKAIWFQVLALFGFV